MYVFSPNSTHSFFTLQRPTDQQRVAQQRKEDQRFPIRVSVGNAVGTRDLRTLLLVRLQVEVDEESEVRGEKPASKQGRRLGPSTVAHVREHTVEVGCRKVFVSWKKN